jgi:CopG family nickel-responsive transcriptional regulator
MPIISLSVNDDTLNTIDKVKQMLKFKGRSELVRTCVTDFLKQHEALAELSGQVEGVLTLINEEKYESDASHLLHEFKHLVKTHLHNHLSSHQCLQVLILEGDADSVVELIGTLKASSKIKHVEFTLAQ